MVKIPFLSESKDKINDIFKRVKKSNEFEFDLNKNKTDITYERYVDIMKYLNHVHVAKKLNLIKTTSLDINYSDIDGNVMENYRISINGNELINKYIGILKSRKNHVIFNVMMNIVKERKYSDKIVAYIKTKLKEDILDIEDYNMRLRLSMEDPITPEMVRSEYTSLDETHIDKIIFRYKQRLSLIIEETKDYKIQIDLTSTKTGNNINKIDTIYPVYELEIEYMNKTGESNKELVLNQILTETELLVKVIQQSNFIISKTLTDNVINDYKKLFNIVDKTPRNLDGRGPVSLEIQHVTEKLANRYAVTDKADGERYFLIVCFGNVFAISQNMKVKNTGIEMKTNKYDGTILDCEYIYLQKFRRHAILPFDCLFYKGEDMRKNPIMMERVQKTHEIVNECFIFDKQKGFTVKQFKGGNNVDNLVKYYTEQLDAYIDAISYDAEYDKQHPLIRTKLFMPVLGIADNEIFKYSAIIWNKYTYDGSKYPYPLDGLIYQPLNQIYTTNIRESKFSDYKWKPSEKNTIDFYIRFEKDRETGKVLNVYDNSNEDNERNKAYIICYLYNGKKTSDGEEIPVYFNEEDKKYISHLYTENGNVYDTNKNILQDGTVVEFYYNNNLETDEKFRWVPLRTRYDKTEMVNKFKVKYGNNSDVAKKIWSSIILPVKMSDIVTLANDLQYTKYLVEMRSKITQEMIVSSAKENVYYQIKTNLAKSMREFHNWVKSVLIFTYFGSYYTGKKLTILDSSIGRGGDIMKFYHAEIESAVGMDNDFATLHNAVDGPISRYDNLKKKFPGFPRMTILCADFTVALDADSQYDVIVDKTPQNKNLLEKIFPKKGMRQFDRINSQFAFHYFLGNEKAWKNVCDNINKCLAPGGIMIITTYDAQRVMDAIGKNNNYAIYYTYNGEKKVFTDIVKKYPDNMKEIGLGVAIDVMNGMVSDEYITEYLIDKTFLTKEMKNKCNMELIESECFDNLYEMNRDFITRAAKSDSNVKTRKYIAEDVASFYEPTDMNQEFFKISRLNRYYVFRKN